MKKQNNAAVDELLRMESARGNAYKRLARCFHHPDKELYQALDHLAKHLSLLESKACPWVEGMQKALAALEALEDLQLDYANLFVGPFNLAAAPYGSVYLEGRRMVMGESTMDVVRRYAEAGVNAAAGFKDAPDHVAAELEFVHYLIFREVQALERAQFDEAADMLALQQAFLQDHLGRWIEPFTAELAANGQTAFYRHLAEAARHFISEDAQRLNGYEPQAAMHPQEQQV